MEADNYFLIGSFDKYIHVPPILSYWSILLLIDKSIPIHTTIAHPSWTMSQKSNLSVLLPLSTWVLLLFVLLGE